MKRRDWCIDMWKDILRRRKVNFRNHPEFLYLKGVLVVTMFLIPRAAWFLCLWITLLTVGFNMCEKTQNFMLPISDEEHKKRQWQESLFYSGFYGSILLLQDLFSTFVRKDPFYTGHFVYHMLLLILLVVFTVDAGVNMGNLKKRKKSVPETVIDVIDSGLGGIFLVQAFVFFIAEGRNGATVHWEWVSEPFKITVAVLLILLELLQTIMIYRSYGVPQLTVPEPKERKRGRK